MTAPDADDSPQVVPMAALSVVTQPGAVKLVHRSGRVLHTFTGPSMREEMRAVADALLGLCDDSGKFRREVEPRKWWAFWR